MDRLEELAFTRINACFTMSAISGSDTGAALVAMSELEDMIDEFYKEYQELVTTDEYTTAKSNPEYFVILIDRVHRHYARLGKEGN